MNVRELLKEVGIVPSKKMGQNFLVSEKISNRIVSACAVEPDNVVFEVGAGFGILTELLCAYGARVFAIEKDSKLFDFLVQRFNTINNLTLLNQDILSIKLSTFKSEISARSGYASDIKALPYSKFKIVSNLPYSISSAFLYWLLNNREEIDSCILTLQKEVANRIYASPGDKNYSSISVLLQFYMEINPLFLIPGDAFFPKSKVVSQVIVLKPKASTPAINENLFFRIVRTAFAERRKKLKNSLKRFNFSGDNCFKLNEAIIPEFGIDLSRRPETLSVEEFIRLTNALQTNVD